MSTSDRVVLFADFLHSHRELLVKPLFWTSHHLEMLGCRFQHVHHPPSMEHTCDERPLKSQPNEKESVARLLASSFSLQGKLSALTNILLSEGSIFDKRR